MDGLAWETGRQPEPVLCRIVCESAAVAVAVHRTGNGARLQLTSERSGARILLDATVLDALCSLGPDHALGLVQAATERHRGPAKEAGAA